MLMVVHHAHFAAQISADGLSSSVNWTVTATRQYDGFKGGSSVFLIVAVDGDFHLIGIFTDAAVAKRKWLMNGEVFAVKQFHNFFALHFFAGGITDFLHCAAEFDLQASRQLQTHLLLQEKTYPSLARLTVDPYHRIVAAV